MNDRKGRNFKSIELYYPEFTKEQVLSAVSLLSKKNKDILEIRYGLNGKESTTLSDMARQFGVDYQYISIKLYVARSKLRDILEGKKKVKEEDNFFNSFPNYDKEQVLSILKIMSIRNRKIIELRYGLNGEQVTSIEDIAKTFSVSEKIIFQKISYVKKMVNTMLQDFDRRINKEKETNLFIHFPEYTREQVLEAVKLLKKKNRKYIELRYGLNGEQVTSIKSIAEMFNSNYNATHQCIQESKRRIGILLERISKKESENKFFSFFEGFSRKQVLDALEILEYKNKRIIELRYGLGEESVTSVENIAKEFNIATNLVYRKVYSICDEIKKVLNNPEQRIKKEKSNNIFYLFPDYQPNQVISAINRLNFVSKKIIELKYGLNGEKINSIGDVASYLGVRTDLIHNRIKCILKEINTILEELYKPKEVIITDEKNSFEENREKIKNIIYLLSDDREKTVMLMRLGYVRGINYSEKQIGEFLNIDSTEVHNIIARALINLSCVSKKLDSKSMQLRKSNNIINL